jgi:hypothetical protein
VNDVPEEKAHGTDYLQVAKDAFESSTTYLDANHRKTFERNIALFQSRHPTGSKYLSQQYKARSRLFRPKTKSVVRKNEAAASAAFFANVDVVTIEPENDADQAQVAGAALMNEVVNYRLTKTIPWFVTVMGAVQEAQVHGIVGSYQYWMYNEADEVDKPCIELMPIENYRFDPAADWTDVVNSSPYFIRMVPMYFDDVRQRMKTEDPKTGQAKWKHLEDGEIRTAMADYDTIRQSREHPKQDPKSEGEDPIKEFEIIWCHENFVRLGGKEVVYWTLGTQHMLTDPVPLKQAYFHGIRPFVIGVAVIEAHKAVPESIVGMGAELQKELNETINQRRDNVSLVLNKRYIVKRGAQVDTDSLLRNVPGGVTLANDIETDVKEMVWPDVTGSAYKEQDYLNLDFDELTGNFSQSSVQTNRKMNETVGGMDIANGAAGQMTEYMLRTIVETWMEKVLDQLVKLEAKYETDIVVLGLAGQKAQLQRYGVDQITDELLDQSLTVRVSMGVGATDPAKKLGRFLGALKAGAEAMQMLPNGNSEAIWNEIFGLAGYKGGTRFVGPSGPNQMMQQQMQEMQQQLQEAMQAAQQAGASEQMAKISAAQANLKAAEANFKAQAVQAKSGIDLAIANNKPATQAPAQDMKPAIERLKLEMDEEVLSLKKQLAVRDVQLAEKTAELQLHNAAHSVEKQTMQAKALITEDVHGAQMQRKDLEMSKRDTEAKADSTSKDLKLQGQEVKHSKEKDKEVEKKVAERPDHSAETLKELTGLIKEMAKPKTKTASKDPKTGAWIVKES